MKIAVDIDGTLSKTFEGYGEFAKQQGFDISGGPTEKFEKWETDMLYPNVPTKEMFDIYEDNWQEMRASYDTFPAAVFILHSLDNEMHALTNRRVFEDAQICSVTLDWLKEHNVPVQSVIHTSDKAVECKKHQFDVLIEDSPKNALPVAESGTHVLLFDKVYNRHVPQHKNITRFSHWLEIPRLLQELSE